MNHNINKNPTNKDLFSIFGFLILLTLSILSKCQN
jgi:hypothetical protein